MSESSYINEGNFRYGITEYDQPCIPQYNSTLHHKKHALRDFPNNTIRDDGMPYNIYAQPLYPSCCNDSCKRKNGINPIAANIINIESSIDRVLTITLYGVTQDLDKKIEMVIGNKYAITYITEYGFETVTGTLGEISSGVPDGCTKYVGNFNSSVTAAYIGLDCSTNGKSDKRLIYIAGIRYIEAIFDDDEDKHPEMTPDEKLNNILTMVSASIDSINTYLESIAPPSNEGEEENNTENEEPPKEEPDKCKNCNGKCCCNCKPPDKPPKPLIDPFSRPGPYQGPLIVGQMHPYPPAKGYGPGRPGIMIEHRHECDCCKEEESSVTLEDILNSMNEAKDILNSFIAEYRNGINTDSCGCCNLDEIKKIVTESISNADIFVEEDSDTDNG